MYSSVCARVRLLVLSARPQPDDPNPFATLVGIVQDDVNAYNVETATDALLTLFG